MRLKFLECKYEMQLTLFLNATKMKILKILEILVLLVRKKLNINV